MPPLLHQATPPPHNGRKPLTQPNLQYHNLHSVFQNLRDTFPSRSTIEAPARRSIRLILSSSQPLCTLTLQPQRFELKRARTPPDRAIPNVPLASRQTLHKSLLSCRVRDTKLHTTRLMNLSSENSCNPTLHPRFRSIPRPVTGSDTRVHRVALWRTNLQPRMPPSSTPCLSHKGSARCTTHLVCNAPIWCLSTAHILSTINKPHINWAPSAIETPCPDHHLSCALQELDLSPFSSQTDGFA